MVDSVLPYFDLSVQLSGVQYEYNHKQTVRYFYNTKYLVHRTRSGTTISCLICTVPPTGVTGWTCVIYLSCFLSLNISLVNGYFRWVFQNFICVFLFLNDAISCYYCFYCTAVWNMFGVNTGCTYNNVHCTDEQNRF